MANHAVIHSDADVRSDININQIGFVIALLVGGTHLIWACLVAVGYAQAVLDFIFALHFIRPGWVVEEFNLIRAVGLVLFSSAAGYAIGALGAFIWSRMRRTARRGAHLVP